MTVLDAFDCSVCDDAELAERRDRPHVAVRAEARITVERLTSILDPRARDVLRMRFERDLRQWETAAVIGCSQMQVSRIIRPSLGGCPPTPSWPAADGR
jgi:RNA polymerase sigma factor (sigma-70 family)